MLCWICAENSWGEGWNEHLGKTHLRIEQTEAARTLTTLNLRSPVRKQREWTPWFF